MSENSENSPALRWPLVYNFHNSKYSGLYTLQRWCVQFIIEKLGRFLNILGNSICSTIIHCTPCTLYTMYTLPCTLYTMYTLPCQRNTSGYSVVGPNLNILNNSNCSTKERIPHVKYGTCNILDCIHRNGVWNIAAYYV